MSDSSGWATPGDGKPSDPRPSDQHPSGPPPSGPPLSGPPPSGPQWTAPQWPGTPGAYPPPGPAPSPKPGVVPLRPLNLSEILDGAITYVRRNPVATLGLSAVVTTVLQLIQLAIIVFVIGEAADVLSDPERVRPDDVIGFVAGTLGASGVGALVSFIGITALSGMLVTVLGQAVLGHRTSLGRAWAAARSRIPGLLGLSLLTSLVLLLVLAAGAVPAVLLGLSGASPGVIFGVAVLGLLVAGAVALFLGVAWSLTTPAYVLENIPVLAAYRRSFRLVRGQWWRVFGILLLATIIAGIVGAVLTVPFQAIGTAIGGSPQPGANVVVPTLLGTVLSTLGGIIAGTLTAPFSAGVSGLLYVDQRIRREAFDLQLQQAAQSPDGALPPPPGT